MYRRRRRPRGNRHLIDSGRVGCPIRGDLDVERCFACNHLIDIVDDENASYVVCRPPVTTLGDDLRIAAGF